MSFPVANDWVAGMSGYLGSSGWTLPAFEDLSTLAQHLGLAAGDTTLVAPGNDGPFKHLQPFFYWACPQVGGSLAGCSSMPAAVMTNNQNMQQNMEFSFNFDSGFQGTDEESKKFYVLVYHPGPAKTCASKAACCAQAGGYWSGNECQ